MADIGGQLTLLGGYNSPSYTSTESIFPSLSSTWTQGYQLIEETNTACTITLTSETFLVIGGFYTRSHLVLYNVTDGTGRRLQDLNYGRWYHGCTLVQNVTYTGVMVAGGYDGDYLSSTELMDVTGEHGRWLEI